jgi:hypothetical protein
MAWMDIPFSRLMAEIRRDLLFLPNSPEIPDGQRATVLALACAPKSRALVHCPCLFFFFALEFLKDSFERRLFCRWCIRSESHRKL